MVPWLVGAGGFIVFAIVWWAAFRWGLTNPNLDSRDFRDNNIQPPP